MKPPTSRKPARIATAALAGALLGWFPATALKDSSAREGNSVAGPPRDFAASAKSERDAPGSTSTRTGSGTARRYATLKREWAEWMATPDAARRAIESMSSTELQTYLLTMNRGDGRSMAQITMSESLRGAAARQLCRRDPEAAMKWAAAQDTAQGGLLETMVRIGVKEDPTLAERWVALAKEKTNEQKANEIAATAWKAAAGKDADILLAQEKSATIGGALGGFGVRGMDFAEGFDFARYVKESTQPMGLRNAFLQWAARDPEQACLSLQSPGGPQGSYLYGAIFEGIATVKGDAAAVTLLTGKLADLPDDLRQEAIVSLLDSRGLTSERMDLLIAATTREDDLVALTEASIIPYGADGKKDLPSTRALASLEPARQLAALEASAKRYLRALANPAQAKQIRDGYDIIMERIALPEESRARVRESLAKAP